MILRLILSKLIFLCYDFLNLEAPKLAEPSALERSPGIVAGELLGLKTHSKERPILIKLVSDLFFHNKKQL